MPDDSQSVITGDLDDLVDTVYAVGIALGLPEFDYRNPGVRCPWPGKMSDTAREVVSKAARLESELSEARREIERLRASSAVWRPVTDTFPEAGAHNPDVLVAAFWFDDSGHAVVSRVPCLAYMSHSRDWRASNGQFLDFRPTHVMTIPVPVQPE